MTTPVEKTLRDRLHEFFHVGEPGMWRCHGKLDICQVGWTRVEPMVQLISEWLRDQGLELTAKGTVLENADFEELAAEAEAGYDDVDGKLVPTRPAVIGYARRQRDRGAGAG